VKILFFKKNLLY